MRVYCFLRRGALLLLREGFFGDAGFVGLDRLRAVVFFPPLSEGGGPRIRDGMRAVIRFLPPVD